MLGGNPSPPCHEELPCPCPQGYLLWEEPCVFAITLFWQKISLERHMHLLLSLDFPVSVLIVVVQTSQYHRPSLVWEPHLPPTVKYCNFWFENA